MKAYKLFLLSFGLSPILAWGQENNSATLPANYCYQVQVRNQHDERAVKEMNEMVAMVRGQQRGDGGLGSAILASYGNALIEKTISASSSLISLGINVLSEVAKSQTRAHRFNTWKTLVEEQNKTVHPIASDTNINDFYYLPSSDGPHDLRNLKFDGFSCYYYIETEQSRLERDMGLGDGRGHDVLYLSCSLRRDSLGVAAMANHTKFMLQLDTLIFYPDYCSVPQDGKGRARNHFDFEKRTDLSLDVNIKVFSSWIGTNEQINSNVKIGEFNIVAVINEESLTEMDGDRVFVFERGNPDQKTEQNVSVSGDSFLVPRSSIGGSEHPTWGTGQYGLEFSVTESCQINPKYYLVPSALKNGEVDPAATANIRNWDKNKWKPEWKALTQQDTTETFIQKAWTTIKTAYIGGDWVQEVTQPLATTLKEEEARALRSLIK